MSDSSDFVARRVGRGRVAGFRTRRQRHIIHLKLFVVRDLCHAASCWCHIDNVDVTIEFGCCNVCSPRPLLVVSCHLFQLRGRWGGVLNVVEERFICGGGVTAIECDDLMS